jgi:hypothetical protein
MLLAKNSSPRVFFFLLSTKNSSLTVFFFTENFFDSRRRGLRQESKGWLSPKILTHGEGSVSGSDDSSICFRGNKVAVVVLL